MDKIKVTNYVILAGGIAIGGAAGFYIAKKKYEAYAEEEIASVKDAYELLKETEVVRETPEPPSDEELAYAEEDLREVSAVLSEHLGYSGEREDRPMVGYSNIPLRTPPTDAELMAKASMDRPPFVDWDDADGDDPEDGDVPNWDRSPDAPYVITVGEYDEEEDTNLYTRIELAYYEEDNTLSDDREAIVPDIEGCVGSKNLNRFGMGSEDPNVVYIRNEKLMADYLVTREEGSYTQTVLGIQEWDTQIQKTKRPETRKLRDDE